MKRIFQSFLVITFIVQIFHTQAKAGTFEENMQSWLRSIGLDGKVNAVSKEYNDDGFVNQFYVDLEEYQPAARTNPNIYALVTQDQNMDEMRLRILNKDIKGTPYLYYDWIAKVAIDTGINKIATLLGLQMTSKKLPDGSSWVDILPAKTTVASRYRFEKLVVHYSVTDLILNIDVKILGPRKYLMAEFVKGELNGILRSLENNSLPNSETIFGRTSSRSIGSSFSSRLLTEVLKEPSQAEIERALRNHEF